MRLNKTPQQNVITKRSMGRAQVLKFNKGSPQVFCINLCKKLLSIW